MNLNHLLDIKVPKRKPKPAVMTEEIAKSTIKTDPANMITEAPMYEPMNFTSARFSTPNYGEQIASLQMRVTNLENSRGRDGTG